MTYVTTQDGIEIFFKDWGPKDAQPIMFHHGWPLSSDDWDAQMLYFLHQGYRVVAHDRRGHGRSAQVDRGHDMDHYAADAFAVVEALDLRNAVHIGHSTGGGEVARYVARHGEPAGRVAKAVLVSAVPPLMLKTEANPEGLPIEVFDGLRAGSIADRSQLYRDIAGGPFFGFNRDGAKPSQGMVDWFWAQGMQGGHKNTYDSIAAFSATDFRSDLARVDVPTLVIHGTKDRLVAPSGGRDTAAAIPARPAQQATPNPHLQQIATALREVNDQLPTDTATRQNVSDVVALVIHSTARTDAAQARDSSNPQVLTTATEMEMTAQQSHETVTDPQARAMPTPSAPASRQAPTARRTPEVSHDVQHDAPRQTPTQRPGRSM